MIVTKGNGGKHEREVKSAINNLEEAGQNHKNQHHQKMKEIEIFYGSKTSLIKVYPKSFSTDLLLNVVEKHK